MIRSIKPITRRVGPVVVMSMMLYYQLAYAAGAYSSSSVTSRIKDELNNAISDFRLLANDIRGDKPSKHEIAVGSDQASIYAYNTINNNDVTARAYSLRNAARQNKLLSAYHEQSTELTLYQHGVIGRQNYSRLGAYLRVEPLESIEETSSFMADQNKEGYSLTLGGDYLFNEHYLFGVALGLPFGEAEEETAKSEIDGLVASGYFSFFRDDWYVDFTASYALIDTDIERRISLYSYS